MDFPSWEPVYEQILADFNFDPSRDVTSARLLASMMAGKRRCDPECLKRKVGKNVCIVGFGKRAEEELFMNPPTGTIVSAGSATATLLNIGIVPKLFFTDLDGESEAEVEASAKGAVAVVLAHGDNEHLITSVLPQFTGPIVPTCQCRPFDGLYNFGGFTDGDRAVMTSRHFGAKEITLYGFDFEDPNLKNGQDLAVKKKKLIWAKRIIFEFEKEMTVISFASDIHQ